MFKKIFGKQGAESLHLIETFVVYNSMERQALNNGVIRRWGYDLAEAENGRNQGETDCMSASDIK